MHNQYMLNQKKFHRKLWNEFEEFEESKDHIKSFEKSLDNAKFLLCYIDDNYVLDLDHSRLQQGMYSY